MRYLPDTNLWIQVLRGNGRIEERFASAVATGEVVIATMVRAELLHGAHRSTTGRDAFGPLENTFALHASVSFNRVAAEHHARVGAGLAAKGTPIGAKDLVIAATALAHGCIVVTHNVREFGRVPGLVVEDWQADAEQANGT